MKILSLILLLPIALLNSGCMSTICYMQSSGKTLSNDDILTLCLLTIPFIIGIYYFIRVQLLLYRNVPQIETSTPAHKPIPQYISPRHIINAIMELEI